jgi:glycogenin glucosyltransferase
MTEAYVTVLTNDRYLPGALVVVNALRDLGTTKRIAILVANVSEETLGLLNTVFDDVINVNPIVSTSLAELADLGRPELASTYTKILIWSQVQFSKVIYLDADVLPLVPIDDFFEVELSEEEPIAASPDAGWPDIFNSGVFITTPSQDTFCGLLSLTQTSEAPSFDGGDQGLLNEYFLSTWKRLSFTFNVTPTAGYQYVPAFIRFFKDIKNVHFIGLNKPWLSRDPSLFASGSFGKGFEVMSSLHQSWWDVFNRHYFGKIAGKIFEISNITHIEDHTEHGEGYLLDIPKLKNQWDDVNFCDKEEEIPDRLQEILPIFPWETEDRAPAERVFDETTDFHV